MIDHNKVIEILEYIQSNNAKNADYSLICNTLHELINYLQYLYDKGYISEFPQSFSSGNPRTHIRPIKAVDTFQDHEHFASIRMTAKGIDFLSNSKKSVGQKLMDKLKENAIEETVKKLFYLFFLLLGVLLTIAFQYYTGFSFK